MSKSTYEVAPEKIVIVAGPSFGQALKFMLLGAALGAGAATYFKPKNRFGAKMGSPKIGKAGLQDIAAKYDAAIEDFSADSNSATDEHGGDVADRVSALTSRLKIIGSRAKQLVETAGEAVKPTLEVALAEGKKAAAEVQNKLKKDVEEAGDKPAIAEQDGDLPSEKEDKFVE
ncbi:hypothetical protein B1R32_101292 [Abditibacterium utsteinense]|uniref:Uncharacterized protein n=1 Tax=Abditibacterium utsteinense TaxID=1960156 RepID=A0A2S8SXM0_9BACT|nr:hypothetical protein [Abditibacterium utsteinense]PQV65550.1 hypothetical protein B1R32_101292 [Abditibacterium utsteinense]